MIIQGDLILVLMEDALRVIDDGREIPKRRGLNPCSNGRYSASLKWKERMENIYCLNPCSNEKYSASKTMIYYIAIKLQGS